MEREKVHLLIRAYWPQQTDYLCVPLDIVFSKGAPQRFCQF